jgi:hypothetical protein
MSILRPFFGRKIDWLGIAKALDLCMLHTESNDLRVVEATLGKVKKVSC